MTTPGDYWVFGINPRFHVLFQRCRQGQNDVNWMSKMFTIELFLPNFAPLGYEGSRGSHLTTRSFMKTKTAAADRPRAGMPAPLATPNNILVCFTYSDGDKILLVDLSAV